MSHTAYAPPQYYNTMDQGQAFSNQVPGMYNAPNGGMPVTTAAPPPAAVLDPPTPTTPVIPAVRKAEDQSLSTPEKKPRTEPEQEWPVATVSVCN